MKFCIMSVEGNNGGVIVLETLCSNLNKLGHSAKIICPCMGKAYQEKKIPYFIKWLGHKVKMLFKPKKFNVSGCKIKRTPFVGKNTIVVYPDLVYGNPLKAKKVVRYMLYYNRFKGDEKAYGKDDLFFSYRPVFNDYELNPTCRTLKIANFNLDIYKHTNFGSRNGKCYIIRKGKDRNDLPKEFDGKIVDDLPESEKVKVFNECEYCISYDTQTAYAKIASMCGCISVVIPEPGKSKSDYLKEGDLDYGLAWGFDENEIKYALETREKILPHYQQINNSAEEEVKKFVEICDQYWFDKETKK